MRFRGVSKLGLAQIVALLGSFLTCVAGAQAQVDINLDSRIQTLLPPPPDPVPPKTIEVVRIPGRVVTRTKTVKKSQDELNAELAAKVGGRERMAILSASERDEQLKSIPKFKTETIKEFIPPTTKLELKSTPLKVQFQVPLSAAYDSNAFTSNTNIQPDSILSFGGALAVDAPVTGTDDRVFFNAASTSARYTRFSSQSLDVLAFSGGYRLFLHATPNTPVAPGIQTVDQLELAVSNTTSFAPTFAQETADFLSPSITLMRSNIPLSSQRCGSGDSEAFCQFANITLAAAHKFSDVTTSQNTNAALGAKLGWKFPEQHLTLLLSGSVTGKNYENVAGGRQDLILVGTPSFVYAPNSIVQASTSVAFTQQYSTLSKARYNDVTVKSGITFIFPVTQ